MDKQISLQLDIITKLLDKTTFDSSVIEGLLTNINNTLIANHNQIIPFITNIRDSLILIEGNTNDSKIKLEEIKIKLDSIITNSNQNLVDNQNVLTELATIKQELIDLGVDATTTISKIDSLITVVNQIEENTDEIETKLDSVISNLSQTDESHSVFTGTGNIPAGYKSVLINNLTNITTVTINSNTFELGDGRRLKVLTLNGEELNTKNGILPAITLSGGTWQWLGLSKLTV